MRHAPSVPGLAPLVYGLLSLFLAFGGFLIAAGVRDAWRGMASGGWPRVPGEVIPRQVEATGGSAAAGAIAVRYTVRGRTYVTDTLRFGLKQETPDRREAELLRWRYPEGGAVAVFYHPGNPALATLTPGVGTDLLWLPGAGAFCALFAVMFGALFRGAGRREGSGMAAGLGLFAGIFMLVGVALLAAGGLTLSRAWRSRTWPVAKGEPARDAPLLPGEVYRYRVGGQTHYANRWRFGPDPGDVPAESTPPEAQPRGAAFDVWHHPEDPDLAVLEPGVTNEAYWLPGVGAVCLLFGLATLSTIVPAIKRGP